MSKSRNQLEVSELKRSVLKHHDDAQTASGRLPSSSVVLHTYPSAICCGVTVLHREGWVKQAPCDLDIAVPPDEAHERLDAVQLHIRSREWFDHWRAIIIRNGRQAVHGLPSLPAAYALADIEAHQESPLTGNDFDLDDHQWRELDEARWRMGLSQKIP